MQLSLPSGVHLIVSLILYLPNEFQTSFIIHIHSRHGQHSLVLPVTNSMSKLSKAYPNLTLYSSIKSHEVRLRSRLYPAVSSSPCYVSVVTRQMCPFSVHSQLPIPENHFGQLQLQPYIHNCMVTIWEGHCQHHFMVFFKRHCCLLENQCLKTMVQGDATTIQGNVIIMRMGSKASYVNLRTGDTKRTDWLMRQWECSYVCRSEWSYSFTDYAGLHCFYILIFCQESIIVKFKNLA